MTVLIINPDYINYEIDDVEQQIENLEKNGAPDKPCGVGCADVNPKTVAKRYMIVQKVVSLHYESEWQ